MLPPMCPYKNPYAGIMSWSMRGYTPHKEHAGIISDRRVFPSTLTYVHCLFHFRWNHPPCNAAVHSTLLWPLRNSTTRHHVVKIRGEISVYATHLSLRLHTGIMSWKLCVPSPSDLCVTYTPDYWYWRNGLGLRWRLCTTNTLFQYQ